MKKREEERFFLTGIHSMDNNLTLLDELTRQRERNLWIIHISAFPDEA